MITSTSDFKLLGWRHSGFSVHNEVRVAQDDAGGRMNLAGYMLRAPIALEKMRYDAATGTVIYHSKMHLGLKRNFQVMPGAAAPAAGPGAGGAGVGGEGGGALRNSVAFDDAGDSLTPASVSRGPGAEVPASVARGSEPELLVLLGRAPACWPRVTSRASGLQASATL